MFILPTKSYAVCVTAACFTFSYSFETENILCLTACFMRIGTEKLYPYFIDGLAVTNETKNVNRNEDMNFRLFNSNIRAPYIILPFTIHNKCLENSYSCGPDTLFIIIRKIISQIANNHFMICIYACMR